MDVPAGETECATTVGTIEGPADDLAFSLSDARTNLRIARMGTVAALHGVGTRNGRKCWRDALHAIDETHVEVPLVIGGERLYAAADWMVRQLFEVGGPERIH